MSLWGPVKTLTSRHEAPSLMGLDWMGWDGHQLGPSVFFKLCGYIDHVYIYLYTYSNSHQRFNGSQKLIFSSSVWGITWRTAWRTAWRIAWLKAWRTACVSGVIIRLFEDGTGRDGRSTKVSFNFLHALWEIRKCAYT